MTTILIIFEHNEDTSYCLYHPIYNCLGQKEDISIELKNLNKSFNLGDTKWFKKIQKLHKRLSVYQGAASDSKTNIVCSLTPKTPIYFKDSITSKNRTILGQKIITTDYASPFLIMKIHQVN